MRKRGDIVTDALALTGLDSNFQTLAAGWLNEIIRSAARDYDYPYHHTTWADQNFASGQVSYTLPSDYKKSDLLFLVQSGEQGSEIDIVDATIFAKRAACGTGAPTVAKIVTTHSDATGMVKTLVFDRAPSDGNYKFRLTYFRMPSEIDTTSAGDDTYVDFEDTAYLLKELQAWCMDHQDDARYSGKKVEAQGKLRTGLLNSNDNDSHSELPLGGGHKQGR